MNTWTRELYLQALHFATIAHKGQSYGGSTKDLYIDYISHPVAVASEVLWCLQQTPQQYNADLCMQCALLHDVLEDTDTTYSKLEQIFGTSVAQGVLALSKNKQLSDKHAQMQDSLNRIKQQPIEVAMVKVADRIINLSEPPFYWKKEKIYSYVEEASFLRNELHYADKLLIERLDARILAYPQFATER